MSVRISYFSSCCHFLKEKLRRKYAVGQLKEGLKDYRKVRFILPVLVPKSVWGKIANFLYGHFSMIPKRGKSRLISMSTLDTFK